ncbi:ABC transporter substrate-binding protein [Streptomyces roseofulvus]|uniref:ABC transporter substrate-binding protein n=2 Tax=Streptomyces TaxID=1883 RepID=A0ABU4KJ43_9ACTN|nr:ABC transporter substrate-binding protein [Streptomyces roseolus]MDX2297499.1 ABC transporter substrate-binding protein [Streptomyces roseolus]
MRISSPLSRRVVVATAAVLAAAGALTACGPADPAASGSGADGKGSAPAKGGTLFVLNSSPQEDFDPARLYTSGGGNVPSLVFRTLTTRNRAAGAEGTKVVPDLATDLGTPSENATVWTYKLKEGLKFEDGSPITSADVKYGVERSFAAELSGGAPYLREWLIGGDSYQGPYGKGKKTLDSIETPDARTIVFRLRKPVGDFPYVATQTQFAPVPKAKDTGAKYEEHPVSSGPYKVVKNTNDGQRLELDRNPHWSEKLDDQRKAYPDTIDVRSGLDSAVINQRLATSSGDDARAVTTDTNLGPAELARIGQDKELKARVGIGHFGYTNYLAFNPKVKPFDQPEVRQAIAYALGRRSVVNAVGGSSLAEAATTFLPNQKAFGYTPYDHFPAGENGNPEKAREVLAKAGHKNGITLTLTHATDEGETGSKVAAAVQQSLRKAGIEVRLEGLEKNAYNERRWDAGDTPGFFISRWGADWPAGYPFLAPIFDGRQIVRDGANFNHAQLDDPAINKEIDEIGKLTDLDAAAARWGALDRKIGERALTVPLYHPVYQRLVGKDIKNVVISDWTGVLDISQVAVK